MHSNHKKKSHRKVAHTSAQSNLKKHLCKTSSKSKHSGHFEGTLAEERQAKISVAGARKGSEGRRKKKEEVLIKIQDQPLIKIQDSQQDLQLGLGLRYLRKQRRDRLKLRRGVLNVKIFGRKRGKKISKHTYFTNQQTLDKYVNKQTHSTSRPFQKPASALNQTTLDPFLHKPIERQQQTD